MNCSIASMLGGRSTSRLPPRFGVGPRSGIARCKARRYWRTNSKRQALRSNGESRTSRLPLLPSSAAASRSSASSLSTTRLPGMEQDAIPSKQPLKSNRAGHACGHHLFGTASTWSAITVKEEMIAKRIKGTLRLYGCPAEEGGSGKVFMVRAGLFNDCDVVLHWHPGSENRAGLETNLANISGKFRFRGKAAHAAGGSTSCEVGTGCRDAVCSRR